VPVGDEQLVDVATPFLKGLAGGNATLIFLVPPDARSLTFILPWMMASEPPEEDEELLELLLDEDEELELLELLEDEELELLEDDVFVPAPHPSIDITGAATTAVPKAFIMKRREVCGTFSSMVSGVLFIVIRCLLF
jgi:hypothetical protein